MNIYKLKYNDKETAIADLISKGAYVEQTIDKEIVLTYGIGVQAIVEIGKVVKVQGTYDDEGNVITEPIYYDGYAYDLMAEQDIDFGSNEVYPIDAIHSFMGYAQDADGPTLV